MTQQNYWFVCVSSDTKTNYGAKAALECKMQLDSKENTKVYFLRKFEVVFQTLKNVFTKYDIAGKYPIQKRVC